MCAAWDECALSASRGPWKRKRSQEYRCIPTWDTGNGLFDHYLPVSLPSTGTACYDCWCAALTGQKHTCKLKHIATILTGVGVQSRPRGGITVMTNSVSKKRVYFFHIWIPISLGDCEAHWRPSQSRLCPMGNLARRSLWLYIWWMREETSRCDQRDRTYVEVVSQKQTSFIRVHLFDSYCGNPAENL